MWQIFKNPLLFTTKISSLCRRTKDIDHVAYISQHMEGENGNIHTIINEASVRYGMTQVSLFDRLKQFNGTCYIETIDKKTNITKAKAFLKKYAGVKYDMKTALFAGIDLPLLGRIFKNKEPSGGMCSWLVSLYLKDQGIDLKIESGNPREIIPSDLFNIKLGAKKVLYKS